MLLCREFPFRLLTMLTPRKSPRSRPCTVNSGSVYKDALAWGKTQPELTPSPRIFKIFPDTILVEIGMTLANSCSGNLDDERFSTQRAPAGIFSYRSHGFPRSGIISHPRNRPHADDGDSDKNALRPYIQVIRSGRRVPGAIESAALRESFFSGRLRGRTI